MRGVSRLDMEMNALDLRRGNLVRYESRICEVIFWNILKNDRRQFVVMKIKDLKTGRITELKEHGDSKFEALENEKVEISHSYRDGNDEVFYTPEGEELRCNKEAAEEALKWPCDAYNGLVVDGALVSVAAPQSVVIEVTETAPPMRGGGSGLKDAVLANGIKVRVGLLVAVGEKVRIDPETLEFKERIAN
jgi:elongation factor P